MQNPILLCDFPGPRYFFLSDQVPSLVYYSHIPLILGTLVVALLIYWKGKHLLSNKVLLLTLTAFASWMVMSLLFWANNRSDIIMLAWGWTLLIEPLVYIGSLYFIKVFIDERDISFKQKLILGGLYLPVILILPTDYSLSGFDIGICVSVEGILALYYIYIIEAILTFWIIAYAIRRYRREVDKKIKKEISSLTVGIVLFLIAFAWGNLIGSFTENWRLGEFGLIGMPIFMCFLAYTIVKFKLFNLKIIGANVLVVTLWILMGSLLLIQDISISHAVVGFTLILAIVFGLFLIRSVRNEVSQREKIEKLAIDLEKANARLKELDQLKSQFLSFASHQVRSPLTAIKGYTSMALEGDFGNVPKKLKEVIGVIDTSAQSLIVIVNEFLDVSRIEQGRMKYEYKDFDANKLVQEVVSELRPNVESKGLTFTYSAEEGKSYTANADIGKIKQVIGNVIDNAIKYTPQGGITVHVGRKEDRINITVSDTGVGVDPEEATKLFSMFSRAKDASKTNVSGTGLGLYVAKQMLEAQKGKIWVESEGKGRGSVFHIELQAK